MVSAEVSTPPARPLIQHYRDYRRFMADFYQFRKSLRAGFSFRRFSQMVGVSSPNYLQLVINGKRNLSADMASRVAAALSLSAHERNYFVALVGIETAKSEEAREQAQRELLRSVKALVSKEIPKAQANVLSQWYHLLVRELVLLPNFEPSGEWISTRLRGLITADEAEQSLAWLLTSGFLRFDKGRYAQNDPVVDTGNAFDEIIGLKFHSSTLQAWSKALAQTDRDLREFGLLNIPIASAKIPELKDRMRKFQDEIIGWLQEETAPDRVVQLGTYLIPITRS